MAIMIPENVGRFTTEGERQVYRFFEMVAKPDPDSSIRGRATLNAYGQRIHEMGSDHATTVPIEDLQLKYPCFEGLNGHFGG